MQVSHTADHVTHAVIGGGETIDFGISNSAEFFNILSSTLYKDQILAVVRESLCNAWDAHIEAGCTDQPVVVTLAEGKLTIKDFGTGIHHDDIGVIYGTYGNSTKKNDGQQTGGFGLGCKSPFAYTEHFEVISCHDGVKTIYAMAKSSAEVGGKPGIKTIAQFPTTERGLTVTINTKLGDVGRFRSLIRRIARNGDMNIHLDGVQIEGLDFDTSKSNWMITSTQLLDNEELVTLRYGNVIYPVDGSHREISDQYSQICDYVKQISGPTPYSRTHRSIVFQAPPHSIAVTPSRESLSMQEHTVLTLKKLFKGFLDQMGAKLEQEKTRLSKVLIDKAVVAKDTLGLLSNEPQFPSSARNTTTTETSISDVPAYATRFLQLYYPEGTEFRKSDIEYRLKELVKTGQLDRGQAKTYLEELQSVKHEKSTRHVFPSSWFARRVNSRLVRKVQEAKLDVNSLYLYSPNEVRNRYSYGRDVQLVVAKKAALKDHYSALPFLKPVLVLTSAKTDIIQRVLDLDDGPFDGEYGKLTGYFIYVYGRKKGDKEEAQKFFATTGMTVIDMSELEPEKIKPVKVVDDTPKKPRPKGLPQAAEALTKSGYISTTRLKLEGVARVTEPKFIVCGNAHRDSRFDGFSDEASKAIIALFGTEVGVASTNAQYQTWIKKFPAAKDFLIPHVLKVAQQCAAIKDYFTKSEAQMNEFRHNLRGDCSYHLTDMLRTSSYLQAKLDIVDKRTDEEKHYSTLLWYIKENFQYSMDDATKQAYSDILDCDIDPKLAAFITKASESTLLPLLDLYKVERGIINTPKEKTFLKMFFYALNN